jgi:DNA polymerase-3 subunit epsilon
MSATRPEYVPLLPSRFAAIDFETADHSPRSACAVAVVRVEADRIVDCRSRLIRPPTSRIVFAPVHGLQWSHLCREEPFRKVWPEFANILAGIDHLVAHNAPFDRQVLRSCCGSSRISPPAVRFVCTAALARKVWGITPTTLANVCAALGIDLPRPHDPLCDAEAAARVVIAARRQLGNLKRASSNDAPGSRSTGYGHG